MAIVKSTKKGAFLSLSVRFDGTDKVPVAQKVALVNPASGGRRFVPVSVTIGTGDSAVTVTGRIPLAVWGKGLGPKKVPLAGDVGGTVQLDEIELARAFACLVTDAAAEPFSPEKQAAAPAQAPDDVTALFAAVK